MKQKSFLDKVKANGIGGILLPLSYLIMALLVVGMLTYFNQLMDQSRSQAIHHLSNQAKMAADKVELEIGRLEDVAETLAVQYILESLQKDPETAHSQLIENLKLHMVGGHFKIITARIRTFSGHTTTLRFGESDEFQLESEILAPEDQSIVLKSSWKVEPTLTTFFQPLKRSKNNWALLELSFSTNEIMSGFQSISPLTENGRLWWIDQDGNPGPGTFDEHFGMSHEMSQRLLGMMDELQAGVIETTCPWHLDHHAFTAIAPIFIGEYDMAVLSSMDAGRITGPQIRLALILSAQFASLLLLAILVLQLTINQRKTALQKLADEKAVIEGMFHSIDDLIFQQDLTGTYTDCNQSFADFFGLTPQEIRGRKDEEIGISPEQIPITEEDRKVLRKATRLASELWLDGRDGRHELVDLHKHPLQHLDEEVYGVIGIGRVKTGQWQSEQNLLKLKEELEEANTNMEEALNRANEFSVEADNANKAKSEFLANMSHEIRTPLGAVVGLTELLTQTDCSSIQLGYLNKLDNSAHSLLGIINDILDFSKIEAGKMSFEIIPFHLGEVISQVTEMFSERVMSRNLYFINKRDQVPELLIGDPVRLRQILVNLLGNALKFTENGGITLTINGGTQMGDKVFMVFSVQDTGIGIPADKLDGLFSSFSQADTSTTRKFGGTGLGLSISQQLVELMGGNIWVESTVGKGTTFHFSLPFDEMDEDAADDFMEEMFHRKSQIATKPGMPLEGLNILLVDDNEINREVISEILSQRGAQVALAENGQQSVHQVTQQKFNLVLMDMQMPVMNGPTATRNIRQNHKSDELPILALTANAQEEDRQTCLAAGMNDYMAKPVDPAELVDKILALTKSQVRHEVPPEQPKEIAQEEDSRIPGIKLTQALSRLGNNKELLIKLMKMFRDQHGDTVAEIDQVLAHGDRDQAIHLAHSLKGTAGNLSANRVQQAASDLESDLRANGPLPEKTPEDLTAAMQEFMSTTKKLLDLAAANTENQASPHTDSDRRQIIQSLIMLKGLVAHNDVSTEDQFNRFRPELENLVEGPTPHNLAQALLIFDFEKARQLVTELIEELSATTV